MIAKKGVAITFNAFFTASGVGATGLTVTVDVYETTTKIVDNVSATEIAGGLYYYTLASGSVDANTNYVAIFKTAGTADQKHIAGQISTPAFVDNIDAPLSTIDTNVDSILEDTGTTLDTKLNTIDGIVDDILVDTGTTLPATLTTIEGKIDTVDNFLDTEVAAILEDTGTTLPNTLATIEGKIDTSYIGISAIKGVTDKVDTALELDGAVYRYTTNALEQAPTGGSAPTAEAIRQEIDANSTQLAAIVADTNELQTNQGNWLTATGFSTHSAADVWAVANRSLTTFGTLVADVWGYVTRALTDKAGFTISGTKTTLDALNDLSTAQVNAEVDTAIADYDPPTKAELDSAVAPLATSASISALNNVSSTDVQTAAAAALTAYDPPTNAEMEARTLPAADYFDPSTDTVTLADGAHGGASATLVLSDYSDFQGEASSLTEAGIADAVWNEATADHATAGSTGAALAAAGAAADPLATVVPGDYPAGTAGYKIANIDNAVTSSNAVVIAAGDASTLNLRIADTYSQAFTSLGTVTGYAKIWFTVKTDRNHADSDALIQIDTTTGLITLNGETGTAANGSITVSDASAGNMTVLLDEAETAKLSERSMCHYNVKALVSGTVTTLAEGRINILNSTTKTIA